MSGRDPVTGRPGAAVDATWPQSRHWRAARTALALRTAVDRVVGLLDEGAPRRDVDSAADTAAELAQRLVGWPSFDAATRVLATARRCTCRSAGTCPDLDEPRRALETALRYDGFAAEPGGGRR